MTTLESAALLDEPSDGRPGDLPGQLNWARVQAVSGLAFAAFLSLHLLTTFSASLGVESFTQVQHAFRLLYQFPLLELGLVLAFALHLVSAWQRRPRGGQGAPASRLPLRRRLHRYAAVYLLLVVAWHALATRGVTLLSGVDAGFGAPSFTLAWLPAVFLPYYFLLAMAGVYHGWYGTLTALHRLGVGGAAALREGPMFWWPVVLAAVLVTLALASFAGLLLPIPDPFDNDYARWYLQMLGAG